MGEPLLDRREVPTARHLTEVRERLGAGATIADAVTLPTAENLTGASLAALGQRLLLAAGMHPATYGDLLAEVSVPWPEVGWRFWTDLSQIQELRLRLLLNLHPERDAAREALAGGVPAENLLLLYGADAQAMADGIRQRLRSLTAGDFDRILNVVAHRSRLSIPLTTERGYLSGPATAPDSRPFVLARDAMVGTYATEVWQLHESIASVLAWVEESAAWKPWQQVTHVWLVRHLLSCPLLDFR